MNIQKKFIEYLKFQNIVVTQNAKDKGVLDVDGDIDLSGMGLVKIPIKFGFINGNLNLSNNFFTEISFFDYFKNIEGHCNLSNNRFLINLIGINCVQGQIDCSNTPLDPSKVNMEQKLPEIEGIF